LALKKAFAEYRIPYFIDEKRSLLNHPLGKFLLDCFRVVRERFSSSAVQALTQNYFFGER
jgi:ATP-dependent helicase/nuclease subunit B